MSMRMVMIGICGHEGIYKVDMATMVTETNRTST